jgi:hypothetical protein
MTESIFSRTFSYRQRENHSPLENYLTEIFAFCLETDPKFRNDFLKHFLQIESPKSNCDVITQLEYDELGRPDIEICYDDTAIIFECKVEASERFNQLLDYVSILTSHKRQSQKHLVFLTKYFEHKELNQKGVKPHLIRWFEVHEFINDTHGQIANQLKLFLKEQDMEKAKNFTLQDMLSMKTISETITKMDELLEQIKPMVIKTFGGFSRDSSRSTRLRDSCYINYVDFKFQNLSYSLLIGFTWWWGEEIELPYVGLSIEIPSKGFDGSELQEIFDKELYKKRQWEFDDYGLLYYSAVKPLTEFIADQDDNIPAIKKYVESNLRTLFELKQRYPKLFKK